MAPVRVVHAFRLPIIAALTALGLAGCVHTSGPVATAQPSSDLDYMAYGQPYASNPAPAGRGLFTAQSFAARPVAYRSATPPVAAYAAAPMPAAAPTYDTADKLDAGDKLRVGGYGPE